MKTLHLLDLIITILFFTLLIGGIFGCLLFIFFILGFDVGTSVASFSTKNKLPIIILLLTVITYYASYVYSIFLFKQNIASFIQLKIFTNTVIKNFKVIGFIYLFGYLISMLSKFNPFYFNDLKEFIETNKSENVLNTLFTAPLNGLIIGLFFLVLSKVFHIAKTQKEENIELKQENELTI
ncbi:DUF2975 domain-containing protein [Myroides sp. JBRI-B21084]|uniref:DUF2975 domain-containing protein n=1 Tax=Myroides sp. JBRI-B21084 TaxID=3119977 RepID=UPI0026E46A5D|nr:DUF2975 domain-containing protein [Paenimyroides cloacae]WKW47514.1 DUF2975 domain-containing protein [Paenimyroides cloacae]